MALAELNRMFDAPTMVRSVMESMGYTVAKFKAAGVEEYDLAELRKAFR